MRGCWRLSDAGVVGLLAGGTALVAVNVEGCHRLYGAASMPPPGFDCRGPGARRPGVLSRLPPAGPAVAAPAGACGKGTCAAQAAAGRSAAAEAGAAQLLCESCQA